MRAAVTLLVTAALALTPGDRNADAARSQGLTACAGDRLASSCGRGAGADIVSDDFERSALGSKWIVHLGSPGIVGGSEVGIRSGVFALLSWAAVFPADQFSAAQISAGTDDVYKGVFVRRRASDGARYQFHYDVSGTDADPRPQWQLKYDGVPTPQTRILEANFSAPAPTAGDVLRIEAHGAEIRGYLNRRLILSARDGELSDGSVGVALLKLGGVSAPTAVFDWWAGGALPRLVALRRSGPLVLNPNRGPRCFSVRFVPNARSRYRFTVSRAGPSAVWNDTGFVEAARPAVVMWCGRSAAKAQTPGRAVPPGRYRASLEVSAAPTGPQIALMPFFARTWMLERRT